MKYKFNEEIYGNLATIYHGTSLSNLEKLLHTKFKPGPGKLHGEGLYGVYNLTPDCQTNTGKYGQRILKLVVNTKKMLNLNAMYINTFLDLEKMNKELDRFPNIPEATRTTIESMIRKNPVLEYTSDISEPLSKWGIEKFVDGLVYTGRQDGECMVVYNMDNYLPLSYRAVGEKEWFKVDKTEFLKTHSNNFLNYRMDTNTKKYKLVDIIQKFRSIPKEQQKQGQDDYVINFVQKNIKTEGIDFSDIMFISYWIELEESELLRVFLNTYSNAKDNDLLQQEFCISCGTDNIIIPKIFIEEYQFDVNKGTDGRGYSALYHAVVSGNLEVVEYLNTICDNLYIDVDALTSAKESYPKIYNYLMKGFIEKKEKVFLNTENLKNLLSYIDGNTIAHYVFAGTSSKEYNEHPFSDEILHKGVSRFVYDADDNWEDGAFDYGWDNPKDYIDAKPEGEDGEYSEDQRTQAGDMSREYTNEENIREVLHNFNRPPYSTSSGSISIDSEKEIYDKCLEIILEDAESNKNEMINILNEIMFNSYTDSYFYDEMVSKIEKMYDEQVAKTEKVKRKTKLRLL